ncbi:SURF1 family protein [Demequina muriae]|uniref:SURF1-like protein n=1 Tax=Demequina muriae TaxID=3051664 RepID=A0ABT8GHK1_9MICO|nr:SURF1 family cytochrome oxidase biogenesis protein [Demequina sp. EGI L300058]MDN4480908.1 SURF1 family cytochrome oxidase biogenesis protein [Demequina sp. EGI L300058]
MTAARRVRWGHVIPATALASAAILVCGTLGWWQWGRASEQGEIRKSDPAAAIADVAAPATTPGSEQGREIWADGQYASSGVALIPDREIDGAPAVLVVRPFTVAADATGTGEEATLPVIVGWLAPEDVPGFDAGAPADRRVTGHLRSGEGAAPAPDPEEHPPEGAFWADRLSPAVLAQEWDAPLYTTLLSADAAEPGLRPLPAPEVERSLDFRSLAYALEWWLFGAFFAFIAGRWIRDNGFHARDAVDTAGAADDPHGGHT